MTELDLFAAAVATPDPAARAALLDRECGGNTALRERLDKLLAAHFAAHPLLDPTADRTRSFADANPTADLDATADRPGRDEVAGAVIGDKYTLVEAIGEGGMGSVWRAKQTEPVKRFVAVKLIKAGMDSKTVLTRFEAERQALALMDHPNIAKVLDGGIHDRRPFFVMELVKGVPITEYCDAHKLTPHQRLELFVQACQAIQHAHQKGIIHRDVKPSNVLVALYDDRPVVKVIDFGVAKATGGTLTEHTLDTGFGGVVGTPQYMSPEQATFNNLDIDTRSDVYALGVLLYELLAGSPPFSRKELEKKGLLEILRVVREEEPPRPSHKLSTADALPSLSANRGTEPKKLTGLLRNELDWIVMKALEKDRTRRYETANGFAADVQRYLSGEAVYAHPPSVGYRVKKFVRRNKVQVVAASLVLLALVAGVVGTTVGLVEAKTQEGKALRAVEEERQAKVREAERAEGEVAAKLEAVEQQKQALASAAAERVAKSEADAKRKYAESSLAVAAKAFELLFAVFSDVNPRSKSVTLGELRTALRNGLVRAAREIDKSDRELQLNLKANVLFAEIRNGLASSLSNLGDDDLAIELYQKALEAVENAEGNDYPRRLVFISNLARAYQNKGDLNKSLPLYEQAAKEAKQRHGVGSKEYLVTTSNLANGYMGVGKYAEALPLLEHVLEVNRKTLGPDHESTLTAMHDVSFALRNLGRLDKALPLAREAYNKAVVVVGPTQYLTLIFKGNLAEILVIRGDLDEAETLFEELIKQWTTTQGTDHPRYFEFMNNLGVLYYNQNRLDKSIPVYEALQKRAAEKLGPNHPTSLHAAANLGMNYLRAGRTADALPFLEAAYDASRKRAELRFVVPALVDGYGQLGRTVPARKLIESELADLDKNYPKTSPQRSGHLAQLSLAMLTAGGHAEAEPLLRECLAIREKKEPDAWTTFNTQSLLGGALLGQKKYADAEPLLLKGYEGLKAREKDIPPPALVRLPEALDRLIELYTATDKPDEVKKYNELRAKYPTPKETLPPPRKDK